MAMEQGLYAQVGMIRRRESYDKKAKENTKKYNFQGQSARSRRWFDLDHEWLEKNPGHVNQVSIENCIKLKLGVVIQKHIKYLECQLVMRK